MPVILGRDFTTADALPKAAQVIMISRGLAARAFGRANPVGRELFVGNVRSPYQVIGVVADSRYGQLRAEPIPIVYQTYLQANTGRGQMVLHVRVSRAPDAVIRELRREITRVDANMPAFRIQTLSTELNATLMPERLAGTLCTVFALLALLLALIGLYATLAYSVAQRTNEIGIRMALGARAGRVSWMVMEEALRLVGIGAAVGLLLSLGAARLISNLLFGITAIDLTTFISATLLMLIAACCASYVPVTRAARVDPMVALRYD